MTVPFVPGFKNFTPDPIWGAQKRVRVDALKPHQRFLAIDGEQYYYERRDGALSGVHHILNTRTGERTQIAGCAEVVLL